MDVVIIGTRAEPESERHTGDYRNTEETRSLGGKGYSLTCPVGVHPVTERRKFGVQRLTVPSCLNPRVTSVTLCPGLFPSERR